MSESVSLPALGESVTEGTVTRWLKNVGDRVEVDEPLLEVSTDKVDTEIPSPIAGVIEEILAAEDETVEVGAPLVRIGTGAAQAATPPVAEVASPPSAPSVPTPQAEEAPQALQAAPEQFVASVVSPQVPQVPLISSADPIPAVPNPAPYQSVTPVTASAPSSYSGYVTPIVRKLASEKGVPLGQLTGTGVGGRIRKQDVLSAASAATPSVVSSPAIQVSPLRGSTVPMSRLRQVIAQRAVNSLSSSAQLTTIVEADVTRIATLRNEVKQEFLQKTGTKLSFLPFFALAALEGLRRYPIINATTENGNISYPETENLSIAVDTERGLLAPVIRNAGDLSIAGLAGQIADLAERTRANRLTPDELSGGTFTLTNTGSRGALFDTPLVFLPQSAILGTGVVVKKPVVLSGDSGDSIGIRSCVYLALSYDHRIIDGADAARFLTAVKTRLEEGNFLSSLGI